MMQTTVLDEAARLHPNSWWWLKGDGTDINAGLRESMKMEWSGDVDLNDGDLQRAYELYQQELRFISQWGLEERQSPDEVLLSLRCNLLRDMEVTRSGWDLSYYSLCMCFILESTLDIFYPFVALEPIGSVRTSLGCSVFCVEGFPLL